MTADTSKLETRESIRRVNEAAREQANMADAVVLTRLFVKLAEVDVWESECLAAGDQTRAEAAMRLSRSLAVYGAAIKRMLDRGEALTIIAELTGLDISELRAVLPYAPKTKKPSADVR
jgi:hypothetical protein